MSEKVLFEIEHVSYLTGRGVLVLAKTIGNPNFTVKPGLELHGCEITEGSIPRKLEKDGKPRLDLWGFVLKNKNDEACFSIGDIVELSQ